MNKDLSIFNIWLTLVVYSQWTLRENDVRVLRLAKFPNAEQDIVFAKFGFVVFTVALFFFSFFLLLRPVNSHRFVELQWMQAGLESITNRRHPFKESLHTWRVQHTCPVCKWAYCFLYCFRVLFANELKGGLFVRVGKKKKKRNPNIFAQHCLHWNGKKGLDLSMSTS